MTPTLQTTCLDALSESTSEVAATVLGATFELLDSGAEVSQGHGAYVGLVAQTEPVQVALLADQSGCQLLAKALLGMEPTDEDLPPADVSDAMCELINIVAGGLKRRVSPGVAVTLGLPIFVAGAPLPSQLLQLQRRAMKLGEVPVEVLLLTQREQVEAISKRGVAH